MNRIPTWFAGLRRLPACMLLVLALAPATARAQISCQTLGWLNAVVEATAPTGRESDAQAIGARLGALYARVDLDALEQAVRDQTEPRSAHEIMTFVWSAKAVAGLGEAWRSPSFITQRAKALLALGRLPCGALDATAERQVTDRVFPGERSTGLFDQLRPRFQAANLVESKGLIFGVAAMGSFGMLALALSRTGRNQRRTKRFPCYIESSLDVDGEWTDVTVIDLSQGGCRVLQDDPPNVGTRGMMELSGTTRRVKVIWNASGTAGIQFDRDLPEAELRQLLSGYRTAPKAARAASPG